MNLKWAEVEPGMSVVMAGDRYDVLKVKPKGKLVKVTVKHKRHGEFTSEVKAKATVEVARAGEMGKSETPLQHRGRQQRWATDDELTTAGLGRGDLTITEPPAKAKGCKWDKPATDPAGIAVENGLGAKLIAETKNEAQGYYVPPVDVTTVAAHMMLFHGGDAWLDNGEAELLRMHELQHAQAKTTGVGFEVNHWHTDRRP